MSGRDPRISLTEDEFQVLIEMFNSLADRNIGKQHRFKNGKKYTLDTRRFIKKLIKLGLKCGWTKLPPCFKGFPDEVN